MTLGGLAGTGKTTVIKFLASMRQEYLAIMALSGKACKVLRSKGLDAQTIHSTIYRPIKGTNPIQWELKQPEEVSGDVFVVDEASMVNRSILIDAKSYKRKILFVGDHGQLEPIGDDPYLMANPDIRLEKIHRQAEGSEIVKFAHRLRNGEAVEYGVFQGVDRLEVVGNASYKGLIDWNPSVVICGFNDTRHAVNGMYRQKLGKTGILDDGDRIICLENNQDHGVVNGDMATVVGKPTFKGNKVFARIRLDGEETEKVIPMNASQFGNTAKVGTGKGKDMTRWDWGYAITCHKAQGSEWKRVAVLEQTMDKWDTRRWAYTAATRAQSTLLYVRKP